MALCSYSCALVVASEEPAELQQAVPLAAGRYFGLRFRRSNDAPTLLHKCQGPFHLVEIDLQDATLSEGEFACIPFLVIQSWRATLARPPERLHA
jgi:hypothetical protein